MHISITMKKYKMVLQILFNKNIYILVFLFSALIDIFFPFLWLVDFPTVICALCTFLFHFPDKVK